MDWNKDEIRQLRYRLGWSQAEMARCMKIDFAMVGDWETGRQAIIEEHRNALINIMHQAESNAERVQRRPMAEAIMRSRGLSQIHDMEVIDSVIDATIDTTKKDPKKDTKAIGRA